MSELASAKAVRLGPSEGRWDVEMCPIEGGIMVQLVRWAIVMAVREKTEEELNNLYRAVGDSIAFATTPYQPVPVQTPLEITEFSRVRFNRVRHARNKTTFRRQLKSEVKRASGVARALNEVNLANHYPEERKEIEQWRVPMWKSWLRGQSDWMLSETTARLTTLRERTRATWEAWSSS